ncbi:MAG: hypothetical protein SPK71_06685 [Prevotella sp.]|nr:hypothetical protein [Prevotella sp.]
MKANYNIKHFIILFVVILGLRILTDSWMMTLGIVMILLLIDRMLIIYDNKRRRDKEENDKKQ